jgi:hypothetical protein
MPRPTTPRFRDIRDRQLREALRVIETELTALEVVGDEDLSADELRLLARHRTLATL